MDINYLGWRIDRMVLKRRVLINREADECGVYLGQHHVLRHIRENPGCSLKDVASALKQSAAAVTLSTKRLEEMGLITKVSDEDNLRVKKLYITEKGERNEDIFRQVIDRYNNLTFDGFTEEELEQLSSYMDRIRANLNPLLENGMQGEEVSRENNKMNNFGKATK